MNLAERNYSDTLHPFGGCNRLLDQYRQVGDALIEYENALGGSFISAPRVLGQFSAGVSMVPVEVLESYLDDLLDINVSDEGLFIKKSRPALRAIALVAIALVALSGAVFVWEGELPRAALPALLVVTFLAGIGSAMYFVPRTPVLRRFKFATVLSREVARRRGHDKSDMGSFATRFLRGDMWKLQERQSTSALPPQPARVAIRYFH